MSSKGAAGGGGEGSLLQKIQSSKGLVALLSVLGVCAIVFYLPREQRLKISNRSGALHKHMQICGITVVDKVIPTKESQWVEAQAIEYKGGESWVAYGGYFRKFLGSKKGIPPKPSGKEVKKIFDSLIAKDDPKLLTEYYELLDGRRKALGHTSRKRNQITKTDARRFKESSYRYRKFVSKLLGGKDAKS